MSAMKSHLLDRIEELETIIKEMNNGDREMRDILHLEIELDTLLNTFDEKYFV